MTPATKYQAYYARNAEHKVRECLERRDPAKHAARATVRRALASGRLHKGGCEVGGDCLGSVQAHHDDYSAPLDVRWLCRRHHQRMHWDERRASA